MGKQLHTDERQGTEPDATLTFSRRDALKGAAASLMGLLTLNHMSPTILQELTRLAGNTPMTGPKLAGILQTERSQWNALLTQVGAERMEIAGVEGEWSVKELVAHLTWYERKVVEAAQQVIGTGSYTRDTSGLAGVPMDERNELIAIESRARPASEVLAEAEQVFTQLMSFVSSVPANVLNDPQLLGLPDDMPPWMRVANNSYAHYREHEEAIRRWLAQQDQSKS